MMNKLLLLCSVYIVQALLLFFEPRLLASLDLEYGLGFKALSNALIIGLVLYVGRFTRKGFKPNLSADKGWRKLVVVLALFIPLALVNGWVGTKVRNATGGGQVVGLSTQEVASELQKSDSKLTPDQAQSIVVTKKIVKLLIGATSEEMVFRWFILASLLSVARVWTSIGLSSLAFGAIHIFSYWSSGDDWATIASLAIPAVFSGVFFGFVFWKYGLPWATFMHFLSNLFPDFRDEPWIGYFGLLILLIACFGLVAIGTQKVFSRSAA